MENARPTCDCDGEMIADGAHYANCKWILSMSKEELGTYYIFSQQDNA